MKYPMNFQNINTIHHLPYLLLIYFISRYSTYIGTYFKCLLIQNKSVSIYILEGGGTELLQYFHEIFIVHCKANSQTEVLSLLTIFYLNEYLLFSPKVAKSRRNYTLENSFRTFSFKYTTMYVHMSRYYRN